jgi:hypothetical protein
MQVFYFPFKWAIAILVVYAFCVFVISAVAITAVVLLWHSYNIAAIIVLVAYLVVAARFVFRLIRSQYP